MFGINDDKDLITFGMTFLRGMDMTLDFKLNKVYFTASNCEPDKEK